MNIKEINNKIINDFLSIEELKPFKNTLLLDIINTLNPANGKYSSETTASKFNRKNHKIFIKLTYKFKNKYSAHLFRLIFLHLVLKNQFLLTIERQKNHVKITLKDGILIHHNEKFSKQQRTIEKMESSFAYKEDSQLISEVFLNTLETIFFSSLYQDNNENIKIFNEKILNAVLQATDDRVEFNSGRTIFQNILNYINKDEKEINIPYEDSMILRLFSKLKELLFAEEPNEDSFVEKKIINRYL